MAFKPDDIAAVAVILLAGSETLSLIPGIKANGWIQLLLSALQGIASDRAKRKGGGRG